MSSDQPPVASSEALQELPPGPYVLANLRADAQVPPTLLNVLNFLYDWNLAFELGRLAVDPRYDHIELGRELAAQNSSRARPLSDSDRLRIRFLRIESPVNVELIAGAVAVAPGIVWILVQIAEKLTNFPLNRRKLKAEVEKLERENEQARLATTRYGDLSTNDALDRRLQDRGTYRAYDNTLKRLERSGFRIDKISVTLVSDDDAQPVDLSE
jgi:hypothetical protein